MKSIEMIDFFVFRKKIIRKVGVYDKYCQERNWCRRIIKKEIRNCRPEFERLLQDIKDKKCNTIVVLKLDRLTRSVFDWEKIIRFLEEKGPVLKMTLDNKRK